MVLSVSPRNGSQGQRRTPSIPENATQGRGQEANFWTPILAYFSTPLDTDDDAVKHADGRHGKLSEGSGHWALVPRRAEHSTARGPGQTLQKRSGQSRQQPPCPPPDFTTPKSPWARPHTCRIDPAQLPEVPRGLAGHDVAEHLMTLVTVKQEVETRADGVEKYPRQPPYLFERSVTRAGTRPLLIPNHCPAIVLQSHGMDSHIERDTEWS